MKLSVIIPARDEERSIGATVREIVGALEKEGIDFEIVVVDDGSRDGTAQEVKKLATKHAGVILVPGAQRPGYGMAVRAGLAACRGDAVAIMMADGSDSAEDLVRCWRALLDGADCVFGSRFIPGGRAIDYPLHKLILNRLANTFIRVLFGLRYNDITNAFKCYRRNVLEGIQPLISPHFNLTVEMPLKAIVRGYSYSVIPISWRNRQHGISKLKVKEMGSRYLFIVLYLWLEKHLARGDYHRRERQQAAGAPDRHV